MSEIEKMYENCNFEKSMGVGSPLALHPFTAEKQLDLIKWLAGFYVHINKEGGEIIISTGGGYISYYAENLADAIALCINSKWNNLTEQERTAIAEILRG